MDGRVGPVRAADRGQAWNVVPLAAVILLLVPGCLEPYRAEVDAAALSHDLPWTRSVAAAATGSDTHTLETDYTFQSGSGPPYPAILQVFSIRDLGRRSTKDLLELTHRLVDNGTAAKNIQAVRDGERDGTRSLANGLETNWFSQEGTVTSSGTLFQQDVRVRIVGEVGYDGRSSTSVIAVGIAQVDASQCTTLLHTCQNQLDTRSWNEMVGDPAGSIRGERNGNGLIYSLVTHG